MVPRVAAGAVLDRDGLGTVTVSLGGLEPARHQQRGVDDDGAQAVGQEMAEDYPPVGGAEGPGRFRGGLGIYDVSNPARPRHITNWVVSGPTVQGTGVHRFDFDGRYAYISPTVEGYVGNIAMILDLADPAKPTEVGRWWIPGQWQAGGETYPWGDGVAPRCHHPLRMGDRLIVERRLRHFAHPTLDAHVANAIAKRIVRNSPEGRSRLDQMSAMALVQGVRRGGGKDTPKENQQKDVIILDVFENTASVKAVMSGWIDYMHMAKWNGRWVIVNVLWENKPAPPPSPSSGRN